MPLPSIRAAMPQMLRNVLSCRRPPLVFVNPELAQTRDASFVVRPELGKEGRVAITPTGVEELIKAGHKCLFIPGRNRAFSNEEYIAAGAELTSHKNIRGMENPIILGVKELPDFMENLNREAIQMYFAHMYKGQPGAKAEIIRYLKSDNELLDLEFLVDAEGQRVAAFGKTAGYNTAAISIMSWCRSMLDEELSQEIPIYQSREDLVKFLKEQLSRVKEATGKTPSCSVMGASGRSGTGAQELLKDVGIEDVLPMGREDTLKEDGSWQDDLADRIKSKNILVNCIYTAPGKKTPLLLGQEVADNPDQLRVVGDVTCDVGVDNPIFNMEDATNFYDPIRKFGGVIVTNIDRTPSMTPREASEEFSQQLLEILVDIDKSGTEGFEVGQRARETFLEHIRMPKLGFDLGKDFSSLSEKCTNKHIETKLLELLKEPGMTSESFKELVEDYIPAGFAHEEKRKFFLEPTAFSQGTENKIAAVANSTVIQEALAELRSEELGASLD